MLCLYLQELNLYTRHLQRSKLDFCKGLIFVDNHHVKLTSLVRCSYLLTLFIISIRAYYVLAKRDANNNINYLMKTMENFVEDFLANTRNVFIADVLNNLIRQIFIWIYDLYLMIMNMAKHLYAEKKEEIRRILEKIFNTRIC